MGVRRLSPQAVRELLLVLLLLGALAAVVTGVAMWLPPLAWIVGGVGVVPIALLFLLDVPAGPAEPRVPRGPGDL